MEKTVILRFTKKTWNKPLIHGLSKECDLVFNILEAKVLPRQESYAIVTLEGTEKEYRKGVEYLKGYSVEVQEVPDRIQRDEDSCVDCGACTAVCPTDALHVAGPEFKVEFDSSKCVACGNCVKVCTVQCIELYLLS